MKINELESIVDAMSERSRQQRSRIHLTLGGLIEKLEEMPEDAEVANLTNPHSYRGYYTDLAFEYDRNTRTVASLLSKCKEDVLGHEFTGYKGGEYMMNEDAPIWVAGYGSCGSRLIDVEIGGDIETIKDDEW